MSRQSLVIQTEDLDTEAATWLSARCRLERASVDDPRFSALLERAEGMVVRTYTDVTPDLLAAAPQLRVVGRAGVGVDNIDLEACARRGVTVVHTPDANTQAVVEYVLAQMLDELRPRTVLDDAVDAASWSRLRRDVVGRRELRDCTLGLLGLGRIGSRMASVATALGMPVRYHDLLEIPESRRAGAEPVSIETLFSESDVLSIHVDGRPSNRDLVGADLLRRLRSDALLINTSRGFVLDHAAVADWLRATPEARARLDVHEPEPILPDHPLLRLPNAALLPHLASRTTPALRRMSWVVRDVHAVLDGDAPRWPAAAAPAPPPDRAG